MKKTVTDIYQIVNGTLDARRLNEQGYLNDYGKTILEPILTGIGTETDKTAGVFVVFDSKYTGTTEGFWMGIDNDGNVMTGMPTNIAGKSEDDSSASFYYDAIKMGEPSWGNA